MLEDRLLRLLDAEQLSSSKFSDVIGVQRSSVSHILSGRNKPSFDFLQKTLKSFPYLNADWLILGEGKMYNTEDVSAGGSLFDQPIARKEELVKDIPETAVNVDSASAISPSESHISDNSDQISEKAAFHTDKQEEIVKIQSDTKKVLKRVILLYSDNSFETYDQGD